MRLPRLTPFRAGCLVILASCLLFASFGGQKPQLVTRLDNQITDAMFRWRGKTPTSGRVVIVDIDEQSLQRFGQWPWPRSTVARLVTAINAARPAVIGLDIVFAEPDRTALKAVVPRLAPLLPRDLRPLIEKAGADPRYDNDALLGEALAAAPSVLGYVFQMEDDGLKDPAAVPFPSLSIAVSPPSFTLAALPLVRAYRAILNQPAIATGESEGFFNVFPDPAGTVRKVPLFIDLDGVPYPSLALEMYRLGRHVNQVTIHASPADGGILGISINEKFIPTDQRGWLNVNFRGPLKTFPYLSAADVMDGNAALALAGKYVLIGTSAAGLLDLRATPFSNVYPGVEVHANVIDNLIGGDPFTYDAYTEAGLTYTAIVAGGLLLTAILAYTSPLVGGIGGVILVSLYLFYGDYQLLFLKNQAVGITYPLFTIFAVFLTVTLCNYFLKDREKRFIQNAFGHYVSPEVVNELMSSPDKLTLKGEERELTVFFNDIRGFTTISEGMTPQELAAFMNEYLTAMSTVILEHQGTVDKYIGDAIMAIWGAPLADEEHAVHAVRAALAMNRRLEALRPEWEKRGLPRVEIGVGLNTGTVSVGNFGSSQRFDYTVLGDNVNLASRLEGLNKVYGTNILISETTRAAIGDTFTCLEVDRVRVKGKKQPVTIFHPLSEGPPEPRVVVGCERFHAMLACYRRRDFTAAARLLEQDLPGLPTTLAALYRERIAACRHAPPPPDWDGVFTATSK